MDGKGIKEWGKTKDQWMRDVRKWNQNHEQRRGPVSIHSHDEFLVTLVSNSQGKQCGKSVTTISSRVSSIQNLSACMENITRFIK